MSHPRTSTSTGPARATPGFLMLLIASGAIISLCMGVRQSLGLFMRPMTLDLGVSAATFGFSIALQNIVWGLSQPVVGALADRHGPRPVLIVTSIVYAAGLALMAVAGAWPGGLAMAGFLIGVGVAGTGFGVLIGVVSRAAPPATRTQTVGIVAAAGSLGTVVIAPAGQMLIGGLGWRPAMLLFAAVAASLALVSLVIREPGRSPGAPGAATQRLREAVVEAVTHRGYLCMMVAFFACGFQLVFIATYLPSYLDLCGVAPGVGATALALIGFFNTIGTYAFGLLGARLSQKRLLALIYLLRTLFIAAFLLLPVSAGSALVFASAMGMLWLGVIPLVTGIIGRVFGLRHFNTLYGIVFLSHQLGSFSGALMGGMVFDRFGNYNAGWAALIAVGLAAFLLQWSMDERPPRRRGPAAPPLPEAA